MGEPDVFQVTGPDGVVVQFMDWAARPGNQRPAPG